MGDAARAQSAGRVNDRCSLLVLAKSGGLLVPRAQALDGTRNDRAILEQLFPKPVPGQDKPEDIMLHGTPAAVLALIGRAQSADVTCKPG